VYKKAKEVSLQLWLF